MIALALVLLIGPLKTKLIGNASYLVSGYVFQKAVLSKMICEDALARFSR